MRLLPSHLDRARANRRPVASFPVEDYSACSLSLFGNVWSESRSFISIPISQPINPPSSNKIIVSPSLAHTTKRDIALSAGTARHFLGFGARDVVVAAPVMIDAVRAESAEAVPFPYPLPAFTDTVTGLSACLMLRLKNDAAYQKQHREQ